VSPTYPPQPQPLLIRPQPPRIYEFTPQQGVEGDLLTITLASDQPGLPLKIGFGSFIAETKQLQQPTYTTLTTRVPSFSLTRCHELGVPLSIITWSGDNEVTDSWLVGYFIYNNLGKYSLGWTVLSGWDLCPCVAITSSSRLLWVGKKTRELVYFALDSISLCNASFGLVRQEKKIGVINSMLFITSS
jgi:hypothetical protein